MPYTKILGMVPCLKWYAHEDEKTSRGVCFQIELTQKFKEASGLAS